MSAKYIFVTGGVVSSLGKGLAAASIGCLLESRGLKVNLMKFDPYLNVDPGTMVVRGDVVLALSASGETEEILRLLATIKRLQVPLISMGCYGIGIERILTAIVEQNNDENGFWLSPQVAPFQVVVVPTNVSDDKIRTTAEDIAKSLEAAGFDVLLDDRDERPGVKFKDADLVGIPFRVNVGKKVTEGTVEVVQRSTRQMHDASIGAITEYFRNLLPAR